MAVVTPIFYSLILLSTTDHAELQGLKGKPQPCALAWSPRGSPMAQLCWRATGPGDQLWALPCHRRDKRNEAVP